MGFGRKVSTTISRNGDLITDIFLEITLKKSGPTFYPAEALIQDIELEIGGQRIDKHYSDWFRIYDALFRKNDEQEQYRRMVDFVDGEADTTVKRFYLPKHDGRKSTPLCASGLCAQENRLDFQGAHASPSQVLVAC